MCVLSLFVHYLSLFWWLGRAVCFDWYFFLSNFTYISELSLFVCLSPHNLIF